MKRNKVASSSSGFSLIEVLVAVLILGIGLLGAASVQILSLQNAGNSHDRTQASLIAQELGELARVSSNPASFDTGNKVSAVNCTDSGAPMTAWCDYLQEHLVDAEYQVNWQGANNTMQIDLWWKERQMYQEAADDGQAAGETKSHYSYQVRFQQGS